jgi:hypothetical protein
VIAGAASKKAKIDLKQNKGLDSNTEPVARSSKHTRGQAASNKTNEHCECLKATALGTLKTFNESCSFMHEGEILTVNLKTDTINKACGMHDWSLLCGVIAFKDCSGLDSMELYLKILAWREHRSITGIRGRML